MEARRGTGNPLFDATIIEEGWGGVEKIGFDRDLYDRHLYSNFKITSIKDFPKSATFSLSFFFRKRIKDFSRKIDAISRKKIVNSTSFFFSKN